MRHTRHKIARRALAFSSLALLFTVSVPQNANAQMNDAPWGFSVQNRASIAALIKQVEDADSGSNNVVNTGAGTVTTVICGGDSADAAATGNSSCVILNNSDGSIVDIGQDASGDQDAASEATETTNVDETINILNGDPGDVEGLVN